MNKLFSLIKNLNSTDLVVVLFCILLSTINLIFSHKVDVWHINILINTAIILYIFFIAKKEKESNNKIWMHLHYWYLVILIFLFFKELYTMIDPIRNVVYDEQLIWIDRLIFGIDPTNELYKISNPILTELLQIVYGTFFFLPVILGIDLLLQRKINEFDKSAFYIVYGFLLSYLGYILVPAIGPRFTLHDFGMNNIEMPGLLLTDFLREIVNFSESIPFGTINPHLVVQRDVFPSGHTQMTLIVIILSFIFNSRLKYFFLINGTLLIFATVYLRYHYVIDLIAGAVFMFFTFLSGKVIYHRWAKFRV